MHSPTMAKLKISVKVECHNERQQGCGKLRKLLELLPEGVAKKSIKIRWAFRLVPQVSVGAGYRHRTRPRLARTGAGGPSKKKNNRAGVLCGAFLVLDGASEANAVGLQQSSLLTCGGL